MTTKSRGPAIEHGDGPLARQMRESLEREKSDAAKEREYLSQQRRSEFEAKRLGISHEIPSASEFGESDWLERDGLRELADRLVHDYDELSFLDEYRVRVLWKAEGGGSKGRSTFGRCARASGLVSFFGVTDWVIWLAADHCRASEFSDYQVEALLYHELLHCVLVGEKDPKPGIVGHDFELFEQEIRRYGFWSSGTQKARDAVQIRLALEGGTP